MRTCFLLFITLLCCGCQQLILGEDEPNDPENNFEIFWNDIDAHYGLFTVRGWDWDSIYTEYRPRVSPAATDEELFAVFAEMVEYLDDAHTFIYWPDRAFVRGNSAREEEVKSEFSARLIIDEYLDVIDLSNENGYVYGQLRDRNIGYLYLDNIDNDDYTFGDRLLDDIGEHDAMIIDLRNNGGGDDEVGAALAGRFADREELAYTVEERNGPRHTDFAGETRYFLRVHGDRQFTKPTIVLTDNITVSAAEVVLLYLAPLPHVTRIGSTTSGDFSDTGMRRFLPNGFQYQYSIMKYLTPAGESLDGVGVRPDIFIENTPETIAEGRDVVLEEAFRFLLEEYGIE